MNEKFFDTWTRDSAYIIGFLMADGNILCKNYIGSNYHGEGYILSINLHIKDIEILEYIAQELESKSPKTRKFIGNDNIYREQAYLVVSSKYMILKLIEHGVIPNKTGKESIPSTLPDYLFPDFLRGYFDGDGSIHNGKQYWKNKEYGQYNLKFVCANDKLLKSFKERLDNIGGKIITNTKDHCCRWQIQSKKDILKIGQLMYKDANFSLTRKKMVFDQIGSL